MDADELLRLLRQQVRAAGSMAKFAEHHGLSEKYLANVLCGRNKPGPKITLSIGFKKVVTFEPVK